MEGLQEARSHARLKQLSYAAVRGADVFGLTNATVAFLLEQLHGAHQCRNHRFRCVSPPLPPLSLQLGQCRLFACRYVYYEHDELDEEPEINASGCARSEVFTERQPHEMFAFLLSKHRPRPQVEVNTAAQDDQLLSTASRYLPRLPSLLSLLLDLCPLVPTGG